MKAPCKNVVAAIDDDAFEKTTPALFFLTVQEFPFELGMEFDKRLHAHPTVVNPCAVRGPTCCVSFNPDGVVENKKPRSCVAVSRGHTPT